MKVVSEGKKEIENVPSLDVKPKSELGPILERIFNRKSFFVLATFLILFISLLLVLIFLQSPPREEISKCGDGTFEGSCSITKPYRCTNQILNVEPSLCGCPSSFQFYNSTCVSGFASSGRNISLKYFLDGEESEIAFWGYDGVADYLSNAKRTITYSKGELPRRSDFIFSKIDEPLQKDYLMSLVVAIQNLAPESKDAQAQIAVSVVQNIPYSFSNLQGSPSFFSVNLSRYPYQVLMDNAGSCEGKSELLAFLLKELGFGVTIFYYSEENHEAVGIKCPLDESYLQTNFCFVESTQPSPISFSSGEYLTSSGRKFLSDAPEVILVSEGIALSEKIDDYSDAKKLEKIILKLKESRSLNPFEESIFNNLKLKYHLIY